MTPGARLAAAMEVLTDIDTRHRPIAEALKDWGVSHRFAGAGDRSSIGNSVYDALRRRRSTAWIMGEDTPRAIVLGTTGRDVGTEALASLADGVGHSPAPLTDDERQRIAALDLSVAPEAVIADIPDWIAPSFARGLGEDWVAEAQALAARPPLDIRVNRLRSDREKVARELSAAGAVETPFSPDGLRIAPAIGNRRHPNLSADEGFRKGWFEIQDEGSQLAALMVGAAPGMQVLDLCAGAGGKTLALAATMANKGQIHATDSDRHRLAPIYDRIKRAGTRNVQVRPPNTDLSDLTGTLDRVLVDAPCTGTGTWRRRPDIKWRLTERSLGERVTQQAGLLRTAAEFVKPGGRLVYVTCSLLPEENQDQIAAFVASNQEFAPLQPAEIVSGMGFDDAAAARLLGVARVTDQGLYLTPLRAGTDGFFVSVLARA